ncbi:MAG: DUF1015 family protein [Actinobacteria bacterium]|nr:DUF1015 family protein [Actinomycetota bacterium]
MRTEATEQLGVRPAHLHIVDPELASRVAAPAYDMVAVGDDRAAAPDPLSYLNVLRAPADDTAPSIALRRNRRTLEQLLHDGVFGASPGPRFAWYRLAVGGHRQTGLIAEVAVRDYDAGRIVRHEHTRAEREEQLAIYQEVVAADASPVSLAYRADARMRDLRERTTAPPPHLRFVADDGVEHTLWTVHDPADIATLCDASTALERLYITDGHHRFAAAARVAAARRAAGGDGDAPEQWLLATLFPDDDLRILPFHRAVTRPRGMAARHLLAELGSRGTVTPLAEPQPPNRSWTFSVLLDGDWFRLAVPAEAVAADPLSQLEVSVLQEQVLAPVLGVTEPRFDPRLSYVAGGTAAVEAHCRHTGAVGFMVRPTTMAQLMTVADADLVMPPKSTLFAPKLRAGIVLRVIR